LTEGGEAADADNAAPISENEGSLCAIVDPRTAGDERLLENFKYAVDHWLPRMSDGAKQQAVAYVLERAGVRQS
jgi:hypothetical protein